MLTKQQKQEVIRQTTETINKSKNIVFADFNQINNESIRKFRQDLKKAGAKFKVIKKTLLKLAFKKAGIDFDPLQFETQVGTIFMSKELEFVAGLIYKFSKDLIKEKKNFKVLGNYEVEKKNFMNSDEFMFIAKLPPREILLAQLAGVLSGPLRAFMYIAKELSKKSSQTVEEKSN